MGYCIEKIDSDFVIKKENFEKALGSLKSVFISENMTRFDYIDGIIYPHFSWVNTETVINSTTLEEALKEIRYDAIFNSDGDICNVEFTGEKYGNEDVFFNALAPYVESDSFISFEGEDGKSWTWFFKNAKVMQVYL